MAPYTPSTAQPWNAMRIKHLYRRLDYGASINTINTALTKDPTTLVDELLDEALAMPLTPAPDWANKSVSDYPSEQVFNEMNQEHIQDSKYQFTENLLTQGLKGRMMLFWMNHFVTQVEVYNCAGYLFQYYDILQRNALGKFKDFTAAIGTTPAMLHYLNGFDNTKDEPNENYARELYELFTLGENNGYTQQDIEETARALTGYNGWTEYCGAITFNPYNTFDTTNKTIFGQEGPWGYDDVIRILFEQKESQIANYICRKLYEHFVSPEISETIVSQMATTFIDSGFEIEPVLRQLFKSAHFFDDASIGMLIKSPIDLTHQFLRETGYQYDEEGLSTIRYINNVLGQDVFQPVDVAGWQGNHDWISSSTLTGRWIMMEWVMYNPLGIELAQNPNQLQPLFRKFVEDVSGNVTDPYVITRAIINHFMAKELTSEADYEIATEIFKGERPDNYYANGYWNLNSDEYAHWQILDLLNHIAKMPEFQLK